MNPEIFIHYRNRLRTRVKIAIENAKILLNITKLYIISSIETAYFYHSEIRVQAKNFKNNINQINRFDYEKLGSNERNIIR